MKVFGSLILAIILNVSFVHAQDGCFSTAYEAQQLQQHASLAAKVNHVQSFIQEQGNTIHASRTENTIIKIPVVVHVLYHQPQHKISDDVIIGQIALLNKAFRRKNADSVNTPAVFKPFAADCEIEFHLATSDPRRRSTNGIVKKYTPITKWTADDKMKFSAEMGNDAWDPSSYLNIWVVDLAKYSGYSSVIGGAANLDGIVIGFPAFGSNQKTLVHEAGHWLGLKHIWGDTYCGDDGVDDTPKQASYTPGCPNTIRITCGNGPFGDMYMNYMDFTSDACTNLFTQGQKARMRSLFNAGGPRASILTSKGLDQPLIFESPLPVQDPKWLEPKVFPVPAQSDLYIDLSYDPRWLGKKISVTGIGGQVLINELISSNVVRLDISRLSPGAYFIAAKREDGRSFIMKFIKQ